MSKIVNNDVKDKNKIVIDQIELITNGIPEQLELINNPNQIGRVINKYNEKISEITPLFMIGNQNALNVQEKVNSLIKAGADPNMEICYYNRNISFTEFIKNYRTGIHI